MTNATATARRFAPAVRTFSTVANAERCADNFAEKFAINFKYMVVAVEVKDVTRFAVVACNLSMVDYSPMFFVQHGIAVVN